jgi:hypothetical protein
MKRLTRIGSFVATAIVATAAGCGGSGSGKSGEPEGTALQGRIMLPAAAQCTGCRNNNVDLAVFGLFHNDAPGAPLATVETDAQGNFETEDLTAALASYAASPDADGDGNRTLIVLATVNADTGAAIGGAISVPAGETAAKDYDATTHVACLATIYLARGTAGAGDPGCVVRADCNDEPAGCVVTLDPDAVDADRIDTLEAAAAFIAGDVTFPADVARAACAVIDCTNGGAARATRACVEGQFASA